MNNKITQPVNDEYGDYEKTRNIYGEMLGRKGKIQNHY